MSAMKCWLALALNAALSFSLLAVCPSALASDLEQHLHDQYQGKKFVLRGFYSNDVLRYDSSGAVVGVATPGDWTSDGFISVQDIHIDGNRMLITATRLLVVSVNHQFQLLALEYKPKDEQLKKPVVLQIEADIGQENPSAEQADAEIAKIFLSKDDHLSTLVPAYWDPCVRLGLVANNDKCQFSEQILATPGVRSEPGLGFGTPTAGTMVTGSGGVFRVGGGVSPPRPTYSPDPPFGERARQAKYEGTVTLALIVNEKGLPTYVKILQPLGGGLDRKAVEAVQQWRFTPAEKDGHPVQVEIAVEVNFHLY